MDLIYFVLWMLLFPICVSICNYIDSKHNKREYSEEARAYNGLFIVVVWFYVGYLLY